MTTLSGLTRFKGRATHFSTAQLLTAIVFIAIFTMAVRRPVDSDTWWHLKAGQYIVEQGHFFRFDPFSHTHLGQSWLYPKLVQLLLYGLYAAGGWAGLSLGLAATVTLAFALLWPVTPGNLYGRAFATILGALTSSLIWVARPQMVSFILGALLLLWLELYKRRGSRWLYLFPLLTALWANMHGGYAIAFMLLAAYAAGETANRLSGHQADPVLTWPQIGRLLLIGLTGYLAVSLNPYGWQMWRYPFMTVNIGILREAIQEWNSPNFHTPITWPFVIMFLLTLTVLGRSPRRVDWSDLAVFGLWSGWSFFAVRNVGLYGLLTVPLLARYTEAVVGPYLPQPRRASPGLARLNWLLLALLLLPAVAQISLTLSQINRQIESDDLPRAAVAFIAAERPPGPLFNSYNWGGYILFKLWPDYPIYIDGRTDLYQNDFIRRYLTVMAGEAGWEQTLTDDRINLVLVESGSGLAKALANQAGWRQLYHDELAVLFARQVALGTGR
jgi:hypothetical protein